MILRVVILFLVLALLLAGIPVSALDASPSAILADPDRFDRQSVSLHGTVTQLQRRVSRRGNAYYSFDLSEGKQAIRVFSFGETSCRDGMMATVEGRFLKVKQQGRYRFYNEVDATSIQCQ